MVSSEKKKILVSFYWAEGDLLHDSFEADFNKYFASIRGHVPQDAKRIVAAGLTFISTPSFGSYLVISLINKKEGTEEMKFLIQSETSPQNSDAWCDIDGKEIEANSWEAAQVIVDKSCQDAGTYDDPLYGVSGPLPKSI